MFKSGTKIQLTYLAVDGTVVAQGVEVIQYDGNLLLVHAIGAADKEFAIPVARCLRVDVLEVPHATPPRVRVLV